MLYKVKIELQKEKKEILVLLELSPFCLIIHNNIDYKRIYTAKTLAEVTKTKLKDKLN